MSPRRDPPRPERVQAIRQTWQNMRRTKAGDRVRLRTSADRRKALRRGEAATVTAVRDSLTLRVVWDDGSLGELHYGRDVWEVVPED